MAGTRITEHVRLEEGALPPDAQARLTLFAMAGAFSMVMIDGTGVAVALPSIQRALQLDQGALQWTITAFALTLAAMLATGGRIGDIVGRVRAFVVGVILFACGTATCALSGSFAVLIAGRVVEGLGDVLMLPAAAALVLEAFPPARRGRAIGAYNGIGGAAMMVGPVVAGTLIGLFGWRAVFLVNIPLAALTLVLLARARPVDLRPPGERLERGHAILLAVGLTVFILGVQESHRWGWLSATTLGVMGAGLVAIAVFALTQLRAAQPLLDVRLFADRWFTGDSIVLFCVQFGALAQQAFSAIYLQRVLRFSAPEVGLAMVVNIAPFMLMSLVAGRLYDRFGVKVAACGGLALLLLSFAAESLLFPAMNFALVVPCLILNGAGTGLALGQTYTDGMSRVAAHKRGSAYGVLDTVRQIGGAVGMAAVGTFIAGAERTSIQSIGAKYAGHSASATDLTHLLAASAQGQAAAVEQLSHLQPAALEALRLSGAAGIAHGYWLAAVASGLGLIAALSLMNARRTAAPVAHVSQ